MQITDVSIRLTEGNSELKAVASIVIDDFLVIHNIRVIETDGNTYISMPAKQTPKGVWIDVAHPLNTEVSEQINKAVLGKYLYAKSCN